MKKYFIFYFLIVAFSLSDFIIAQNVKDKSDVEKAVLEYFRKIDAKRSNSNLFKPAPGQSKKDLLKPFGTSAFVEGEKNFLMNGNNIVVDLYNYGGIGGGLPTASIRDIGGLVWNKLSYIFQFVPIVGASVTDANGKQVHIISDALYDYSTPGLREESPTGERWVWKPLPGYADPDQPYIASNPAYDSDRDGKPDSWPREWYNEALSEYVWPGYLKQGENNADLEVYWAMDDRDNKEFAYFPYDNDLNKRGLGLQIDARAFQWSNSLAANAIFFVYTITNKSDKDLDTVFFGIYGDPDIGGVDNDDDNGYFIPPYGAGTENIPVYSRSMVYFFDPDAKGDRGLPLGYLGCKFLESPGNSEDRIDNDGDGHIDERQDDGRDNDGDWNIETDDLGLDGISNTGDLGEGDGLPTAGRRQPDGSPDPLAPGEPNFEFTDLDESDQIGLTSFNSWTWNQDKISNDESMWFRSVPGNFGEIQQETDIVFVFGSGYISLKKGETKRISMAFLFGDKLTTLLNNAETVQDIYNKNYRFFRPPDVPTVSAVPDDKKVTLYWDTKAEQSIDPITGKDFEGYVIYRSTSPTFEDQLNITDGRGSDFLTDPLITPEGFEAKWDLDNGWRGFHPVSYQNRGVHYYLGDDIGLRHTYVDSNNVINGQTYYYAVVAYDHGDSLGIPPTETTKKISLDPITSQLRFDKNTVQVIAGPRTNGYITPTLSNDNVLHQSGTGNGSVQFQIVDDLKTKDGSYRLTFSNTMLVDSQAVNIKNYSIEALQPVTSEVMLFDLKPTAFENANLIIDENLAVKDENGKVFVSGVDYELDAEKGTIRRLENSSMPDKSRFFVTYRYFPIYQSTALRNEDINAVFDGILLKVNDYAAIVPDSVNSKWIEGGRTTPVSAALSILGTRKAVYPGDYRITFTGGKTDSAFVLAGGRQTKILSNIRVEEVSTGIARPVNVFIGDSNRDSLYTRGEIFYLYSPNAVGGLATDTLNWMLTVARATPQDSLPLKEGDVYFFSTQRPFTNSDVFSLNTSSGKVQITNGEDALKNIYVVPNPYVGVNDLEPANRLASQNRGERRIYFENLPQRCTIRIFTVGGELVQQLEHDSNLSNGRQFWNLLNKDGFSVAYGVYLAHIEAPGIGETLIKFALIK